MQQQIKDLFHDNSFPSILSLLANCTATAPSTELQRTLPALLWMFLSSLGLKDTVKVQKKLKPCSSQLKNA